MVPSPVTGWFTVMSDRVEIERLIKDLRIFNNEPEESEDVSLSHRCGACAVSSTGIILIYFICCVQIHTQWCTWTIWIPFD